MNRQLRLSISGRRSPRRRAFTLIELLVVVTIIVMLVTMLLPALKSTGETTDMVVCQSNQRQIAVAWVSYATDNASCLCSSQTGVYNAWVRNGNTTADLKAGVLAPYLGYAYDVYLCPRRNSTNAALPYVRSFSLSNYANGTGWIPKIATRMSHWASLGTGLLMLDEWDPRGYNEGSWVTGTPYLYNGAWIDWPANWHFGDRNSLTYADGHGEIYKFRDATTSQISAFYTPAPNNVDRQFYERIYYTDPSR